MREFFTPELKQILAQSVKLTGQLGCNRVNSALFLLAWMEALPENCRGTQLLLQHGATLKQVRREALFHLEMSDKIERLRQEVAGQAVNFEPEFTEDLLELLQTSFEICRRLRLEQIAPEHLLMAITRGKNKASFYLSQAGCDVRGLRSILWEVSRETKLEELANLPILRDSDRESFDDVPSRQQTYYEEGLIKLVGFSEGCSTVLRQSLESAKVRRADCVEIVDVLAELCAALPYPYQQIAAKNDLTASQVVAVTETKPGSSDVLVFLFSFSPDLDRVLLRAKEIAEKSLSPLVELPHLFYAILTSNVEETRLLLPKVCKLEPLLGEVEDALDGSFAAIEPSALVIENSYVELKTAQDSLSLPLTEQAMATLIHAGRFTFMLRNKSSVTTKTLFYSFCCVEIKSSRFNLPTSRIAMDWAPGLQGNSSEQGDLLALPLSDAVVKVLKEASRVALGEPGALIHPAHILLALTRIADQDFVDCLAEMPATNLQVRLFLDYLFEQNKLVWKPPVQLVAGGKRSGSPVLTSPLPAAEQTDSKSEAVTGLSLPDNCTVAFRETLENCLADCVEIGVELCGFTRTLEYVLSSPLMQLTRRGERSVDPQSKILTAKFTDPVYHLLHKASFRSRNLGLPLNHWSFLLAVATDKPFDLKGSLSFLSSFSDFDLRDVFKRLLPSVSAREVLSEPLRENPAAWAGFSKRAAAIWQDAEQAMREKNIDTFQDEYLLLAICRYLEKEQPQILQALKIECRDVERLVSKIHRPESAISFRRPCSANAFEIIFKAERNVFWLKGQEVEPHDLLLVIAQMRESNSAWILGTLLIDSWMMEAAVHAVLEAEKLKERGEKANLQQVPKSPGLYRLECALQSARESASATRYGELRTGHLLVGLLYSDKQLAECMEKCSGFGKAQIWSLVSMYLYPDARGPYHQGGIRNSDGVNTILQRAHEFLSGGNAGKSLELIDVFEILLSSKEEEDLQQLFSQLDIEVDYVLKNVVALYSREAG